MAEVLITLGIIGIVVAMTMPTLIAKYQKQTYVAILQKVYTEVNQALRHIMADKLVDNPVDAGLTSQAALEDWVETYFKKVKDCGHEAEPCFAPVSSYKKINYLGNEPLAWDVTFDTTVYTLANGATVRLYYSSSEYRLFSVIVDVNGPKKPNIIGRDWFVLLVYKNGVIDDYFPEKMALLSYEDRESMFTERCIRANTNVYGCFGKILNDGWKMNY